MYTTNNEKNLASIKSRMGWQVGLQAGTLLAIGNLNSSVQNQTEIISSELQNIQDVNIDGFQNIETALNSLESSLIAGFEDLKWFLGSIDDKLARIIGLVEFPKSTASSEQYIFGMELFKQEYYEKSIISFNSAIEKNPLNLNAKIGLYLALKEKDKKEDLELLQEIIHLTDSNFTLNLDVSDEAKNNSIKFFSNFVFNELSRLEKFDLIIDYYENHLVDVAKQELNIRIRYLASKINNNIDYESDLRMILEDGDLLNLLCFIEYKKDKKFVDFLLKCSEILDETFSKYSKLEFSEDDTLCIRRSAATLVKSINNESQLIKLASIKKTLAYKHSILNNFFEKAAEAPNIYKVDELKLTTANLSIEKLNKNQDLKFDIEKNEFLADSHKIIIKEINNKLNNFKKKNLDGLATIVKNQKVVLDEFKMNYPAIEDEEQESFDSIVTLISSIDEKKKEIDFSIAFEDLSEISQDRAELNESLASIKKTVNETVSKIGRTKAIELFSKIKKSDGSGIYGKKWAKEMVTKHTN
tara:strand:+ start:265 stop:1845 length:1581 start_codon:yes stop_codon:yes gene_type:complete